MRAILPIVEGDGDKRAVPELIRRVLHEVLHVHDVRVLQAHTRGDLPKVRRQFQRFYEAALLEGAPILWVLDFDCADCLDHVREREALHARANTLHPAGILEVVFVVKEFESMFLHNADALREAFPELPHGQALPEHPESIRDAKGWISKHLPKGRAYKETVDQARLCHHIDLDRTRRASASFARFETAVRTLVERSAP